MHRISIRIDTALPRLTKMNRTYRSAPVLSPSTAKALVETFADGYASSSSDSPDSLYSNDSPTFPDAAFEFDVESSEVERDEDDYESIMDSNYESPALSPAWGRWPELSSGGAGWSPKEGNRTRSIISISPGQSRRGSQAKLKVDTRKDSDSSLLGFELAQRRRSSTKSLASRRRSSFCQTWKPRRMRG